jgi:hypothetical protein
MSTTMLEDVRPTTETLSQLLVGLGFGAEQLDTMELLIDEFDQWTNSPGAVLTCSCTQWHGDGFASR